MLGHFSAGFTLDTYARVTSAAQNEAAISWGELCLMRSGNFESETYLASGTKSNYNIAK